MAHAVRSQGLDKFYTLESVAQMCIDLTDDTLSIDSFDTVIEPSAGNGSFYTNITHSNLIGIDIEPEHADIIEMDFFNYTPEPNTNILIIGNPPFGRVSSLAVRFFNHAAQWANAIAFIVPRTFRKTSIQNRLNLNFVLIDDIDIPTKPCSFVPKMSVKCCFQIWKRTYEPRAIVSLPEAHKHWMFLKHGPKDDNNQPTPPDNADFAIRAYGGKIGFIQCNDLNTLRPKSWHWIRANIDVDELIQRFDSLDYSSSVNTARQNSIGKKELVQLYTQRFDSVIE